MPKQVRHDIFVTELLSFTIDAHNLPFDDKSFDVVILYEAIYYLEHPERFIEEARRVLRENGTLLICTANKDWSGFNPSPYTYKYFSAPELFLLRKGKTEKDIFWKIKALTT
jgi:ubiquinone/menaquinone biosynthesis C-methylase UbiE